LKTRCSSGPANTVATTSMSIMMKTFTASPKVSFTPTSAGSSYLISGYPTWTVLRLLENCANPAGNVCSHDFESGLRIRGPGAHSRQTTGLFGISDATGSPSSLFPPCERNHGCPEAHLTYDRSATSGPCDSRLYAC
jgi:hypothetical protein